MNRITAGAIVCGAFLLLLTSIGFAAPASTPSNFIPGGGGPSYWSFSNPRTMALRDYLSQTSDCMLFYAKTASLREKYAKVKAGMVPGDADMADSTLLALKSRIEAYQPVGFSCPLKLDSSNRAN